MGEEWSTKLRKSETNFFSKTLRDTCILIISSGSLIKALKKTSFMYNPISDRYDRSVKFVNHTKGGRSGPGGGGVDQFKFNHIYTFAIYSYMNISFCWSCSCITDICGWQRTQKTQKCMRGRSGPHTLSYAVHSSPHAEF